LKAGDARQLEGKVGLEARIFPPAAVQDFPMHAVISRFLNGTTNRSYTAHTDSTVIQHKLVFDTNKANWLVAHKLHPIIHTHFFPPSATHAACFGGQVGSKALLWLSVEVRYNRNSRYSSIG